MRALLSVWDKTGIDVLAAALHDCGFEIVSTGGTLRALEAAGVPVAPVSAVTAFPEMMDGRVKTLHPAVHGGLLALRDDPAHREAMAAHGMGAAFICPEACGAEAHAANLRSTLPLRHPLRS